MKGFEVYMKVAEYHVLKCPYCKHVFRYTPKSKVFGNKVSNAVCQSCEKPFSIKKNSLKRDPLLDVWGYTEKDSLIKINPDGTQKFFKKTKIKAPEIKTAKELI